MQNRIENLETHHNEKQRKTKNESRTRIKSIKNQHKFYIREKVTSSKQVTSPKRIFDELKYITDIDQESFFVFYLNTKNKIIKKDLVFLGGVNSVEIDLKILFRRIFLNNASAFIVAHNHPSGSTEDSPEDRMLTRKLKKAADLLDVSFLDHVIIGNNSYNSLAKKGII